MAANAQPCIKPQAEWLCQRHGWMDVPSRGCPISCKESLQSQSLRLGCHSEPQMPIWTSSETLPLFTLPG